jgi:hypothetical protein
VARLGLAGRDDAMQAYLTAAVLGLAAASVLGPEWFDSFSTMTERQAIRGSTPRSRVGLNLRGVTWNQY